MDLSVGLYADFYVKQKSLLLPLIEEYSGQKINGSMPHGKVIALYIDLLKNDPAFKSELDTVIGSKMKGRFKNAADPITGAEGVLSGILGFFGSIASNRGALDSELTTAILAKQKAANTQNALIVGGIIIASLGIIGLGIYLVVKKRRT